MKNKIKNDLTGLKNIGPTIAKRLNAIGVFSQADLADMTAVEAYKKICQNNMDKTIPVCYYLYSLEGALLDVHWNEVPEIIKQDLLVQVA